MPEKNKPCVFLDRDGTITEEVGYVNHLSRLRLIPGAARAIRRLNDADILSVVVTNQAGVARGYFTEDLVRSVMGKMEDLLSEDADASLNAIYYCPHHPTAGDPPYRQDCRCRKPRPGMVEHACEELPIDMDNSYMIGDRRTDITFGHAVGLKTVLVMTGYGMGDWEHHREEFDYEPDHVAMDLAEAVNWILSDLKLRRALAKDNEA